MGLVLAIDPGRRQTKALDRLTQDLAGHDIVVAASCGEALEVLDTRLPDLLLFPLFLSPGDEARLQARLRDLPSRADIRALTIPFAACAEGEKGAARPTAVPPRWFYWFRPAAMEGLDELDAASPRALASRVRADLHGLSVPPPATVPPAARRRQAGDGATAERFTREAATAKAWAPCAPAPSVETIVIDSITNHALSDDEGSSEEVESKTEPGGEDAIGARVRGHADVWTRHDTEGRESAASATRPLDSVVQPRLDDPLGRLVAFGSRAPRSLYLGLSAFAVLLMLGVSGPALVGFPMRWLQAARTSSAAPLAVGMVDLQSDPTGAHVFIGERELGTTPLKTELPAGTHTVEFRHEGSAQTVTITVEPGATVTERIAWKAQRATGVPKATGSLTIDTQPQGAAVFIDRVSAGRTPLVLDNLAVGAHDVQLKLGGNVVTRTVDIRAGKTVTLDTGVYGGWLALFSPIELTVRANGRTLALDERNRVLLSAGSHALTLENRALGFSTERTVEIKSGEVTAESFDVPKTQLSVTASAPSEVWVDGAKAGETPLVDWPIEIGTRDVVLRASGRIDHKLTVTATVQPVHLKVDFP